MKRTLLSAALLVLLSGAVPFLCLLFPAPASGDAVPEVTASPETALPDATPVPAEVTLYDEAIQAERTLSVPEFLIGAAACEMPPDWPEDAICAQMVASRSYALYQVLQGTVFTVNSDRCSGWTTDEVLQSRWGDAYADNRSRLAGLADRVGASVLLYDGQPAAACYHAISCGRTEASQNVWQTALPYLQGVDSAWDRFCEDYEVTVQYSADQVSDALGSLGLTPEGDASEWVGDAVWDEAGYVRSIELCGQSVSGTRVRQALSLRSACFAIAWRGGEFVITTRGYGHGVGLSQYGARAMAEGGASWQQILTYYYPGCEIGEG